MVSGSRFRVHGFRLYNMAEDIIRSEENVDVEGIGSRISDDIGQIIEHSKHAVAVYLNLIRK